MAIAFKCPNCQTPYKVKDDMAGRKVVCTACKKPLRVPAPVASAAVPDPEADALAAAALADAPAAPAEQAAASITVECPNCMEQVTFPSDRAGKQAPCPNCRRVIRVPVPATGKADWRTADARPTFAKAAPDTELKDAVGTHQRSIVSREALEEADALRKREREPWPLRTKINYAIISVCAVALIGTGALLFRGKQVVQRRDDLVQRAVELVTNNPALPAGVRAETYRAAGEYVLAQPDAKADVAADHLRNARGAFSDKSTDHSFERLALLARIAVTQAGLVGDAEQIRLGQRLEWKKSIEETRRTLEQFDNDREGIVLAARDLARGLGTRGPNNAPAIRTLLATRFDPPTRADAQAAAALELFAMDEAGKTAAGEWADAIRGEVGQGEALILPRVIALHVALNRALPGLREPSGNDSPPRDVRLGCAEGYARRGDVGRAREVAAMAGSPEDRFQAHVAVAAATGDAADLSATVDLFAKEFKNRDLPDWPLIRLARLCGESKSPDAGKALATALAQLSDLAPRSQAVRAWAMMELRPATVEAVKAISPETALGHLLAWEWLGRRSPGSAEGATDQAKPLALVGTALGSIGR